jgi:hypothetical protein
LPSSMIGSLVIQIVIPPIADDRHNGRKSSGQPP